jgi:hypothetical protein
MNGFRNAVSVSDTMSPQLIAIDLPGLSAIASKKALEKPLGRSTVSPVLQVNIHHFPALVHR